MPVIAEIEKEFRFEAAHFLPFVNEEHKCRSMHGHSYRVVIRVRGPIDEKMGWVMDLGDLNGVFEPLRKQLDHSLLNKIKGLENPTSENLAAWILEKISNKISLVSSISVKATNQVKVTINRANT